MASIEKRKNKDGEVTSYRIIVSGGFDYTGKRIKHSKIWTPDKKMTARQIEKALARASADFEREIEQGFILDNKQTFAEYSRYVLELKERSGTKLRTLENYKKLLPRIDKAIGHIKLSELRPQHLNSFYKNLSEQGIRSEIGKATAYIDLAELLKHKGLAQAEIARRCKISSSTVSNAVKGKPIQTDKAELIAKALDMRFSDIFTAQYNTEVLAPATILVYHAFISTVLAQAEKEMLVLYNAADKATKPKLQKHEPDYFQPEQIKAILHALDTAPLKWKALVYVLIDTGCRRGEACGMAWNKLDLQTGTWTIDQQLLYSPEKGVYTGTTKTGKSRTVALSPVTLKLLKRLRLEQYEIRMISGSLWTDTGFTFTQDSGQPVHPDTITKWLREFSKQNDLPHIHPHAFRHTAASLMIASGTDLVTTANELGHATATTTANIYAHQIQQAKAKAAEARHSVLLNFSDCG